MAKPWQAKISRRRFLGVGAALAGAGALAGYLPESVFRAAHASSKSKFDLSQIKHVVYLMQENRSFDHYFGTFPGVRGFSDRRAMTLQSGQSVFQQPDPYNPDGYLEPFHLDTATTAAAAVPSLSHDWRDQHASWNRGAMDSFVRAHVAADSPARGEYTMGYYEQADIPFHWALAQSFTLLDNYHCSVLGPTIPNRMMFMTGTIDPLGNNGGPVLETATPPNPTWTTAAEVLWNAGYRFHIYQDSLAFSSGFGIFQMFDQFKNQSDVPAGLYNAIWQSGTLFGDGTPGGVGNPANPTAATNAALAFEEDCANGVLPDVSWLIPYVDVQEHPPALPAAGAQWIASKLDALAQNEELWNSTVFVINYDENDGFFDHVAPPTPNRTEYPEEFVDRISVNGTPGGGLPIGGGFRVPCVIISPWSTGGRIYSEVADHTSGLQFLEAVTAAGGLSGKGPVTFPEISRWRRATFDNFTGALAPGAVRPAPTSNQFDPTVRASDLAQQQAAVADFPLPKFPGVAQTMPKQDS